MPCRYSDHVLKVHPLHAPSAATRSQQRFVCHADSALTVQAATSAPLIERSIERATGIVYNITGGSDLTLQEVNRWVL